MDLDVLVLMSPCLQQALPFGVCQRLWNEWTWHFECTGCPGESSRQGKFLWRYAVLYLFIRLLSRILSIRLPFIPTSIRISVKQLIKMKCESGWLPWYNRSFFTLLLTVVIYCVLLPCICLPLPLYYTFTLDTPFEINHSGRSTLCYHAKNHSSRQPNIPTPIGIPWRILKMLSSSLLPLILIASCFVWNLNVGYLALFWEIRLLFTKKKKGVQNRWVYKKFAILEKSQMCSKTRPSTLPFQTLVSACSNRQRLDAPAQVRIERRRWFQVGFYWLIDTKVKLHLVIECVMSYGMKKERAVRRCKSTSSTGARNRPRDGTLYRYNG
jgi:hypothetical protein